jgi:hypothetical protein
MPSLTYDTSIFISYKPEAFPSGFLMSAVVIQEIVASARDNSELQRWNAARRAYEKEGRLIVPDAEDWWMASKILYWLSKGRRRRVGGKAPRLKLKPGASQRMALDALIAVSARRYQAAVVTENWEDFRAIQYYCDFKLIRGSDFFK